MIRLVKSALLVVACTLTGLASAQTYRPWMSPDIPKAWRDNYLGQGVTITVVDDFSTSQTFTGNLKGWTERQRHGYWTSTEASMVAPFATMRNWDFGQRQTIDLKSGLNVINASYGVKSNNASVWVNLDDKNTSVVNYALQGRAVIAKAAGNENAPLDNYWAHRDLLTLRLKGAQSAILVGALRSNGSPEAKASMASYSNRPGSDRTYQNQFLVVGVNSSNTGLSGTSYAAPIISGYAAILGSKFRSATPTQVTNQLLNTARKDTLVNYDPAVYGRGEASLRRALSPQAIN
jgi:subtilisin family serine protease